MSGSTTPDRERPATGAPTKPGRPGEGAERQDPPGQMPRQDPGAGPDRQPGTK
jgi:hypothetical protein